MWLIDLLFGLLLVAAIAALAFAVRERARSELGSRRSATRSRG